MMINKIISYFRQNTNIFEKIDDTHYISEWKSKVLSDEIIKPPTTFDNNLAPMLCYIGKKNKIKILWKLFKAK